MTLHAHIWNEQEGVHKKQGCGMSCENECKKGNINPSHARIPTIDWNKWLSDRKESMSC